MSNIALLISLINKSHAPADGMQIRKGEIISGELASRIPVDGNGDPVPPTHTWMAWVVITGVPQENLASLRTRLLPAVIDEETGTVLHKRRVRIRADDLPSAVKNELANQRWTIRSWTAVKGYMRDLALDRDLDDADVS